MKRVIIHNFIEQMFLVWREYLIDVQVINFDEAKWDALRINCIQKKLFDIYTFAIYCERAGLIKILSSSTDLIDELQEEIANE